MLTFLGIGLVIGSGVLVILSKRGERKIKKVKE